MIRQAMGASDMVLAQHGENLNCWLARGHVLAIDGNKNAAFCFTQCMSMTRELDWKTPFLIGLIYDGERYFSRAIPYFKKALEMRPSLPYALYRIALCHAAMGRSEAARNALNVAEDICPEEAAGLLRKIRSAGTGSFFNRFLRYFRRR
jgi:tetratricopeptide (TPR) repeat protein